MKRRQIAASALLCAVLLTGCVSQKEYDVLAQERDNLRAQVEALSLELDGAKDDVVELQDYTRQLVEENDELRDALRDTEKESAEQQKKIEDFIKTIEELETQNRSTLPSLPTLPSAPSLSAGESVQSALDAFSEMLELVGRPLGVR